ncbi:MAG: serine hydrolase domain-containing protein [Pseudomonadota bacterium]
MHKLVRSSVGGLLLLMALAGCVSRSAPPAGTQLDRELAALAGDPVLGLSSLSVLAVRDGRVKYQGAFGHRFLHPSDPEQHQAANPDTLYRIASVSKFVTMLGVMRLVEAGTLSLDRDVGDYLGYQLRNPAFPNQALTLRMLLSHTSSLRDDAGYSWNAETSLQSGMAAKSGAWDSKRGPGAYFAYSNLNWGVIGTAMEAVTGERFDLLMRRLVLDPLEIRGGFNVAALSGADQDNLATLYRKRVPEGGPWRAGGPWFAQVDVPGQRHLAIAGLEHYVAGRNGTVFSPTGGLRISAAGLGKIMLMLLDGGRYRNSQFLSRATLQQIFATQWRYDPAAANGDTYHGLFTHWGLGTQHFDKLLGGASYPSSGHLGEAYGLLSVFAINFAERSGMVVLIGGTASDPSSTPGSYSALSRQEELVLTALHRHLLQDR